MWSQLRTPPTPLWYKALENRSCSVGLRSRQQLTWARAAKRQPICRAVGPISRNYRSSWTPKTKYLSKESRKGYSHSWAETLKASTPQAFAPRLKTTVRPRRRRMRGASRMAASSDSLSTRARRWRPRLPPATESRSTRTWCRPSTPISSRACYSSSIATICPSHNQTPCRSIQTPT